MQKLKDTKVSIYNQYINVIKDIKKYFEVRDININDCYFKFGYDRLNQLMCLIANYKKLSNYHGSGEVFALYGLNHNGKLIQENKTIMYLEYRKCDGGSIEIIDFFSIKQKCCHGSFILENLYDVIT